MLKNLLRNTELAQILDFVSPAFWQVVPAQEVWRTGKQLVSNFRAGQPFQQALAAITGDRFPELQTTADAPSSGVPLSSIDSERRTEVGHRILWLYFSQLFHADTTVLDLRPERFSLVESPGQEPLLHWGPRPYFIRWPASFLEGIRGMYRGFYQGDSELFDRALAQLKLTPAKAAFIKHFGEDQDAVLFRTSHLVRSLHESFVCCRQDKQRLSGAFLALGFYLTTLYQSLESLDVALDAKAAFNRAIQR